MKVLLFGASGSGTTTLGKELERRTDFVHLDTDDYYWEVTDPPFQIKIPLSKRNSHLRIDFCNSNNVVLSGSLVNWGEEWQTAFDLAIFVRLEHGERMRRLKIREEERYGKRLVTDHKIKLNSDAFLKWADQYEHSDFNGRSLKIHMKWMKQLDCKLMEINSAHSIIYNIEKILKEIKMLSGNLFI